MKQKNFSKAEGASVREKCTGERVFSNQGQFGLEKMSILSELL